MEVSSWQWGELVESNKQNDKSSPRTECLGFREFKVEDMAKDANKRPMKRWRDDWKDENTRRAYKISSKW